MVSGYNVALIPFGVRPTEFKIAPRIALSQ